MSINRDGSLENIMSAERTYGSVENQATKKNVYLSLDDMLSLVGGFGPFQWIVDAIFCLMMFPASYPVLIMHFTTTVPSWKCHSNSSICLINGTILGEDTLRCHMPKSEWTFIGEKENSMVTSFNLDCQNTWILNLTTSIFFIGWGIGAIILGALADCYGRLSILFPSFAILLISGLVSAFIDNIWLFITCRFITGFVSSVGLQMFVLVSEYVDTKHRALAGNLMYVSSSISLCLLGLMAYFVRKWKILFIICTGPYLILLLFYKFVPESFRWLHLHGKMEEIDKIFTRISKWNNVELSAGIILPPKENNGELKSKPFHFFRSVSWLTKTTILCYLWFCVCLVYYGLSLASSDLGGSRYRNFVLITATEVPATIFAIGMMERFGRKKTALITMLLSGVACICVSVTPNEQIFRIIRVSLGMLGKLFTTVSVRTVFTWTVEIYPTAIRAEAIGLLQFASRIGAGSAPWIVNGFKYHKNAPFVIMGCLAMFGAILIFFLPETKGKGMSEYSEICDDNEKQEWDRSIVT